MANIVALKSDPLAPAGVAERRGRESTVKGSIRLHDVSMIFKRAGVETKAVDNVELTIEAGEFISFLGPSGCGKSTVLNMIAGIFPPSSGQVLIDDMPVREPNPTCNVVFQQHSLFPWMTVLQNVAFGPKMLGNANPEGVGRTFLSMVGLERFKDAYPATLSGGMQQRVAIARALATYPPVLLMDEPFGALDAQTRTIMQEELLKIWSEFRTTVIFVTHDIDEAIFLSDRIIVMRTQPGAIKTQIKVDLPRPRTLNVVLEPEFGALRKQIIELIREETLKVFNT